MMNHGEEIQRENENLKQRVAELEAQLAQNQRIVERLPQLVYVFDVTEQRNIFTNRGLAEMLGYTPDEIRAMGDNVLPQVVHPHDMSTVIPQHFAKLAAAQDGEVVDVEYRLRASTGEWRWVLTRDVVFARKEDGSLWQSLGSVQDITERKQTEEYRQLIEFSLNRAADGVHWINPEGWQIYVNDALCHNLGYTREEMLNMQVSDVDPNFPIEAFQGAWNDIKQRGSDTFETTHRRKDGSILAVEIRANYLEFNGQEYICSFIRDMTERKQMEEQLQEREERLRFILDGSLDGAWDANLVTGETYYSPRYAEILGYQPDEMAPVVETWLNSIHPDDAGEVKQLFQDYLAGKIAEYVCEHRLRHKSGRWLWVLSRGKVTSHTPDGQPARMAGTVTDITERKQQEDELRTFKALVEASPDGIGIAAMDGTITYANRAFQQLSKYGEAMIGKNFLSLYPEEQQEAVADSSQEVAAQGFWQGDLTLQCADGQQVPIQLSSFIIHDEQGQPVSMSGMVRDLTEQQQAEAERVALQEQVIAAQRDALRELSTPLIPLSPTVVLMPLIGTIDSSRAQLVMETLLEGIAAHQSETAILDITGVQVVDTQVANALVQAAQAVRLLGAQVVLTGIGPSMAQTLVHLGADLSSITTRGSLQAGIASALAQH